MTRYSLSFLLIAVSAIAGLSANVQAEPLEFGYIELPPFGYTNSEGEASGYLAKLSKQVFQEMGLPVHYQQHPASRLYHQLKTGDTALTMGPAGLHQLRRAALESQEPAITLTLAIYHRQDTDPVFSVENLKGKRVVLMQGYSYGRLRRFFEEEADNMQINYARTHVSALKMLLYERADYLLNYQIPAETVIARNGLSGLKGQVIGKTPIHLFVSRQTDGAQQIIEQWDHHLRKLKQNDGLPTFHYYKKFE
ncbi:polar amino acid transport system substrate-binding protein [Halospina denitrificans]|uniref:Polar amino acid transport system substrate-binding protein n=1 Tax=Halospina denitrificans TaxID=332522 RepID=A0A4R7K0L5_9GAMM|nr:transporter substrate-binding domain-containing protein [Halospina denitrificans]TDT43403.1 polar amino acid transport system substrate-binding protein [Halospina denitrificans]